MATRCVQNKVGMQWLKLRNISLFDLRVCRHGFWGIFLLAAWPNALFDLCGICCGHFLMPFWEFIGATMAGKALVKARLLLPHPALPNQAPHRGSI